MGIYRYIYIYKYIFLNICIYIDVFLCSSAGSQTLVAASHRCSSSLQYWCNMYASFFLPEPRNCCLTETQSSKPKKQNSARKFAPLRQLMINLCICIYIDIYEYIFIYIYIYICIYLQMSFCAAQQDCIPLPPLRTDAHHPCNISAICMLHSSCLNHEIAV